MARLPFDPHRVSEPSNTPAPVTKTRQGDAAPLTVSQANKLVKDTLARTLPAKVRIVGQVSNFTDRSHWFFSIKDAGASLRCVCFASVARKSGVPMSDGLEIIITGRFDVYDAQGQLQFYVDKLEPVGQGALEMQYRALCEKLRAQGYFDTDRKKPLPLLPRKVAIVTSRAAAALQDVINTASRRWAGCQLYLVDVRVQGAAAAPQIAQAINALSRNGKTLGIDAIILTRGGGSIEDLWAFNDPAVADAVFKCTLPIVAAIGHETDTTIAELVADHRSSTPTQAAMTLIPDQQTWDHQIHQHGRRLNLLMERMMEHARRRVEAAARHTLFRRPVNMLEPLQTRLTSLADQLHDVMTRAVGDRKNHVENLARHLVAIGPQSEIRNHHRRLESLAARLQTATQRSVSQRKDRLEAASRHLAAVGPARVLGRGYTYTIDAQGRPMTSAIAITPGDTLTTVFADGKVQSVVQSPEGETVPASPSPSSLSTLPTQPKKRVRNVSRSQDKTPPAAGLFTGLGDEQ